MSRSTILTIVLVLLLVSMAGVAVKLAVGNKGGTLISPQVEKVESKLTVKTPTPTNNAPKEIKYDSTTDLKQELDTVNPQVLDSDF